MSIVRNHLRRYGLALFGAAAIAGCSSGGTTNNNTGTIALSVSPASGSVQQGGQLTTTATLTRGGGFTGTVNLTVTGAPTGVTAVVSGVQTSGTTTTATVTINVAATTVVGVYPLVVHGNGTGVTEALANYGLTVTAAPAPAYTLTLSSAALTILQGAATPTTTVNLARTNFTGNVTLSVDNLPTGVTAAFLPANPQTGNSSVLTLTVAGTAPTGTFTNLLVRGVSSLADRTAPLSLTITAPAPGFALSLSNAALTIPQGSSAPTTTVNIARTNFTGDVALSVLNLPTGVTAAFAPANPQTGNSSVLTLTVAAGAPTGTFTNLSVQGVGTGLTGTVSTPLSLTISTGTPAGGFTLSTVPPTSVGITQGNNANVTVNINRTGGNTSNIALTATGTLPTGMTLTFVPASTTTNSSVLTITTTGATPVGATPIVIRGNTAGLGEQTVNLTINVAAPGGSGNVTVTFATCPASGKAVWLAFMDGTAGTWTAVTGVGDVYQFNITQSKGSFAYVTLGTGTSTIIVQQMTQAELTAATLNFCGTTTPNTRVANGTYSNLPVGYVGQISFGGGLALAAGTATGPFQITNAMTGTFDLIGYAKLPAMGGGGDRVFVKRGENPAPAGNFSVPVNFTDGTLSSLAQAASATVTGLTGSETQSFLNATFYTGGTACTTALLYSQTSVAANFTLYGVPGSLRNPATDMHGLFITVSNGTTSFRTLIENFLDVAARAATPFALPLQLPVPVATDAGGPYKRPSIAVTGVAAELNLSHTMTYQDQTATGKTGVVTASQGWVGGSNVTLVLPNFAGVGTFNNAWAPATGDALNWSISSAGGTFTGGCTAGQRFVTAGRSGTL